MYNVLWIDDLYETPDMVQFAIEAEHEDIMLEGYTSFEEGFEVLEKRLVDFDGILLDGLFFEKKGQVAGTEDIHGIGLAIGKINELKSKKYFPWFVLSGQDKFTKGENDILKSNKAKCYDKSNPADVVKLFAEMKQEMSQQPTTQLKLKYNALLEVCADQFLGPDHFFRLFSLIEHLESGLNTRGGEDKLTAMRKMVEGVFKKLADYEVIPGQFVGSKGWINGAHHFLSGNHPDYVREMEIIPPIVCTNIERLLDVIQDGSHAYGALKLEVDDYMRNGQSDFFFRSTVYQLFDLLLWFKTFLANNTDLDSNKARWKAKLAHGEWILGRVIKINDKGYGLFQPENTRSTISIPPYMLTLNGISLNDRVKVITKPGPDDTKPHIDKISSI